MSKRLRFQRWEIPQGTSLAAILPEGTDLTGIYVLEFSDGELYVGQTVSLLARYASHARKWRGEISAIRFAPVPVEQLNQAEQDVVARLVDAGSKLRNIDLVALPLRSAALDVIVDPGHQQEWLSGEVSTVDIGNRGLIAKQRERTRQNFELLSAHKEFDSLLNALTTYIELCIPMPHLTEGRFWTVTSMPKTERSSKWRRLSTLSINKVEVLVLGEFRMDGVGDWQPGGFMNMSLSGKTWRSYGFFVGTEVYKSVGEVAFVEFGDFIQLQAILAHKRWLEATRSLAMGLLRKGTGIFGRYHDYNLSDSIFRTIENNRGIVQE